MLKPLSRSLTLLSFSAAGNVSLAPFSQVTCAESAPASQAFNLSEEVPAGPSSARIP